MKWISIDKDVAFHIMEAELLEKTRKGCVITLRSGKKIKTKCDFDEMLEYLSETDEKEKEEKSTDGVDKQ